MTAQQNRFSVIAGVNESGQQEAGAQSMQRVAALWGILFALLLGAAAWVAVANEVNTTRASISTAPVAPAQTVQEIGYFPSTYVNQGTEIEEHIQAF